MSNQEHELKQKQKQQNKHEVRITTQPAGQRFTIRSNSDGTRSVEGYFATFGTISHDLGFREVLQQGCFTESLREQPVAAYRDHNDQMLLGKTQSGSLEVSEDSKGLSFRVKLPDTSYANDLVALMERGDSYECSFGMVVAPDGEEWSQLPNGEILRTITKALLFEGSILTGPAAAYPNTAANLRSCPADIRAKLTRHDDDEDDEDYDPCDPDSDDYDEDACDEQDEDRDVCSACGQTIVNKEDDATRSANLTLLLHRLR